MVTLSVDQSGDLHYGYFYKLHICREDERTFGETSEWIVSKLPPRREFHQWTYCAIFDNKSLKKYDCPIDPLHETGEVDIEFTVECSGEEEGEFIPEMDCAILRADLAKRLIASGLTGFKVIPAKVRADEGSIIPELRGLTFVGRDIWRRRKVAPPEGNRCPFCGDAPYICPACDAGGGRICQKCRRVILMTAEERTGPDDPRITTIPTKKWILEGKLWDGSDFLAGTSHGIITRRALDFLLSIHAAPFKAEPVYVDLRGCDAAQLKRLEAAKTPLPVKAN